MMYTYKDKLIRCFFLSVFDYFEFNLGSLINNKLVQLFIIKWNFTENQDIINTLYERKYTL